MNEFTVRCIRCGNHFFPSENNDSVCKYHSGEYEKHVSWWAAMRRWSCCGAVGEKAVGCCTGSHVEDKETTNRIRAMEEKLMEGEKWKDVINNGGKVENTVVQTTTTCCTGEFSEEMSGSEKKVEDKEMIEEFHRKQISLIQHKSFVRYGVSLTNEDATIYLQLNEWNVEKALLRLKEDCQWEKSKSEQNK